MTGLIVCSGTIEDYTYYKKLIEKADLIICADGGANHLRKLGVTPHVLMGDFDSIAQENLAFFRQSGTDIMEFPVEKDMTDAELAVEYVIGKGCDTIILIGVLGTRMDHSLANIFLLKRMLDQGISGVIVNEKNEITLIKDKIQLHREENTKVSLIPISQKVVGISTKGLYYPLENATISMGSTWGISNEFISDTADISIQEGLLLVIKSRD